MNFCSGCLDPAVSTNQPGADGRDVSNLISLDPDVRNLGYVAEYFIRPPVDIKVTFSLPVDISHIKLIARLERHCSTGFVIFTQPENLNSDSAESDHHVGSTSPHESSSREFDLRTEDNNIFLRVGSYLTDTEDCLLLSNPHYKQWIKIKMPSVDIPTNQRVFKGTLKHSNRLALRCVKSMIVRISRTFESCRPVLKALEVWGQPGISAKAVLRKTVIDKWLNRIPEVSFLPLLPRIYNSEPVKQHQPTADVKTSESKESFEIPEDFLDPLTCEVMTVPLLLPSGHSIDAHVLERFIVNESLWGRPASDPFTGVPFKPGQKPSSNVALKLRIDRFLALNAEHPLVQTCGRTLGNIGYLGNDSGVNFSSSQTSEIEKRKHRSDSDLLNESCITPESSCCSESKNTETPQNSFSDEIASKKTKITKESDKYCNNLSDAAGTSSSTTFQKHSDIPKRNSVTLKQSLRRERSSLLSSNALKSSTRHGLIHMIGSAINHTQQRSESVKSNISSVDKPSSVIHGEANRYNFSLTDIISQRSLTCGCGVKSGLYKFPCNHVICRKCLLEGPMNSKTSDRRCKECSQTYKSSEVTRFHQNGIFS